MQDSPLWWILVQTPLLLVYCAGIILSAVLWRRHRQVCLIVALVLAAFCVEIMAMPILYRVIPGLFGFAEPDTYLWVYHIVGFVEALLNALLWCLLLLAIFGWRQPPVLTYPPPFPAPPAATEQR